MVGVIENMKMKVIVFVIKVVYYLVQGFNGKLIFVFINFDCFLKRLDNDNDRVFVLEIIQMNKCVYLE